MNMATEEVFMDIPSVEKMAQQFENFGDVLDGISKAVEAIAVSLKTAAFFSFGMTYAAGVYMEKLAPKIKKAADKMRELSRDLRSAIVAYRDGDFSGSRRFC
jgi:uncharacterized protein YukE